MSKIIKSLFGGKEKYTVVDEESHPRVEAFPSDDEHKVNENERIKIKNDLDMKIDRELKCYTPVAYINLGYVILYTAFLCLYAMAT